MDTPTDATAATATAPPAGVDAARHPCFDPDARHRFGRVHLPVAPRCNVQCNFCDRKYDCVNESRPGVTSVVLQPWQAARYFAELKAADPTLTVAGIAGPGDPFANADETLETFRLIRAEDPDAILCVASNGLGLPQHVEALADLRVGHVTVTVNAVDPGIGRGIYAWIRDGGRVLRGREAAELLLERQRAAIAGLVARGVMVKVNSILVPGVNDDHIPEVAREVAALGASYFNVMALRPTANTEFADVPAPDAATVARVRGEAGRHLAQMSHCARCRADAAGRIGATMTAEQFTVIERHAAAIPDGSRRRYLAVASRDGRAVDLHLGEADALVILALEGDAIRQVGVRKTPPPQAGAERWDRLAALLGDCRALLVNAIGAMPLAVLRDSGLRVYEVEGAIGDHAGAAWRGGEVMRMARPSGGCGCGGDRRGHGCA